MRNIANKLKFVDNVTDNSSEVRTGRIYLNLLDVLAAHKDKIKQNVDLDLWICLFFERIKINSAQKNSFLEIIGGILNA